MDALTKLRILSISMIRLSVSYLILLRCFYLLHMKPDLPNFRLYDS